MNALMFSISFSVSTHWGSQYGRGRKTKIVVVLLFLLLLSFFAFSVFPVSAQSKVSINSDHELNNPSEWIPATWGLAREGADIFPEMKMTDGIATTTLNSYAGKGEWDSASYKQDKYQGSTSFQIAPLTSESTISYKVKPFYENPGKHACFNVFVEIWVNFSEPVGVANGRVAELMFKQRVVTSPDISSQPENSYTSTINPDAGWGDWYLITYRLPDVPFNQWTQQELSWNKYFNDKLREYNVDLTKGHIYALIFGIEGFSASGGVGAQWDYVNCMTNMPAPISPAPKETSTPIYETPKPTVYSLTPQPTLTYSIPLATQSPEQILKNNTAPANVTTQMPTPSLTPTLTATPTQFQSLSPSFSPNETAAYQHSNQQKPQTTTNYELINLLVAALVASIVTAVVIAIKKTRKTHSD